MSKKFEFKIEHDKDVGQRLDIFLAQNLSDVSRSYIQTLIKQEKILVNEFKKTAHYKTRLNDQITVIIPDPVAYDLKPEKIPLDIVYEDKHLLVINKPAGLVVHPACGHREHTLVNAILHHCKSLSGINGVLRPGIVHRLDKDTSGLMLIAKDDKTHQGLSEQLKQRKISRTYLALCHGKFPADQKFESLIGRNKTNRKMMSVLKDSGKHAVSFFKIKKRFKNYTLLEVNLETGRTHQIRVHLKHLGYPIIGDPVYGCLKKDKQNKLSIARQALHATAIRFIHPILLKEIYLECPLPNDMQEVIAKLE